MWGGEEEVRRWEDRGVVASQVCSADVERGWVVGSGCGVRVKMWVTWGVGSVAVLWSSAVEVWPFPPCPCTNRPPSS